jgi:hypothetical protein
MLNLRLKVSTQGGNLPNYQIIKEYPILTAEENILHFCETIQKSI